ncbi:MAG: glycoside hydrolase family 15 protein [Promethearchaeota archaeon]|nr:MAG: glycoside hydrolase family 15 protein [Candidatus Lokiarchaeota archaeon]
MPRSIIYGNRSLLVCLDKYYNIRDIYYPHVGLENHLNGHKCRIGIWVDHKFNWLEKETWEKEIKYFQNTLVGNSIFKNKELNIKLIINDCVFHRNNIFLRKIEVENLSREKKECKIFFSHDLQIYGTNVGITAYYDDNSKAIVHYLRDRWFLFSGMGENGTSINSYATGKAHFGESKGTYIDAEDGILSENPIAQGSVDSTIQINLNLNSNEKKCLSYWFCVGRDYSEVRNLHEFIKETGISEAIEKVKVFDKSWSKKSNLNFFDLSEKTINLFHQSILIVKSQMDHKGAIIAANDSDILQFNKDHYSYMWPRDGALVACALDKAGYPFLTRKFYEFCANVATRGGFLLHKYNPDGSLGSSWHPWYEKSEGLTLAIQEDETALVLYALGEHYDRYKDLDLISKLYNKFIEPAADFLVEFRDKRGLPLPSYDLWEERKGIHAFTVASIYSGLKSASKFSRMFGESKKAENYDKVANKLKKVTLKYLFDKELNRFLRTVNFDHNDQIKKDEVIDSSLFALFEFEMFSSTDPRIKSTMQQIESNLWVQTDCGGVARYENDYYHRVSDKIKKIPGNPWYISTLWLARWYISKAKEKDSKENLEKAKDLIEWVVRHTLPSFILAEQVNPDTSEPLSVSPLTWSHATFIRTVFEYLESYAYINRCESCQQPISLSKKDKKLIKEIKRSTE